MSSINREALIQKLRSHTINRDGRAVLPEWVQVAIKDAENLPEDTPQIAYWKLQSCKNNVSYTDFDSISRGLSWGCSLCHFGVRSKTPEICPHCGTRMINGSKQSFLHRSTCIAMLCIAQRYERNHPHKNTLNNIDKGD